MYSSLNHYVNNLSFCSHGLHKCPYILFPLFIIHAYLCICVIMWTNLLVHTLVVCSSWYVSFAYFVQTQPNGSDCGLFAVAFAMAICLDQAPEDLYLNVKLMRSHLSFCLVKKKMKAFPSRSRNAKKREKSIETVPGYCKCRWTERGRMICCDTCSEWYHDTSKLWTYPDSIWTCNACTL